MISFHDSRLRLTSGGEEIGDWDRSVYQLSRVDPATFVLSAEGEDLTFRPALPDEFAIPSMKGTVEARRGTSQSPDTDTQEQAPPAKPLTLVFFYLLVAGTAAMAVWALTSFIG